MTSPALLEILRCPACNAGTLDDAESGGDGATTLLCGDCGQDYPSLRGIPDLSLFHQLDAATVREVEAQDRCAGDIYDNPQTLAYYWDPIDTAELARHLPKGADRVLDVGSGLGLLGDLTASWVVGMDLSMELLRRARRRLSEVVRADAGRLPFQDDAFDALFVRGTLHHLVSHAAPIAEMRRVLAPGGVALFSDPRAFAVLERLKGLLRRESRYYAESHRAFSVDEYQRLIGRYFDIESVRLRHGPGVVLLNALDAFFFGRFLPALPALAEGLHFVDRAFGRPGPLENLGMVIEVVARGRS